MKPLREWIEEHRDDYSVPTPEVTFDHESGIHMGWSLAMDRVLKELQAREDAGQERKGECDLGQLYDKVRRCGNAAHANIDDALDAAWELKDEAARWRSLLCKLLAGEMTHGRRAELKKELDITKENKA